MFFFLSSLDVCFFLVLECWMFFYGLVGWLVLFFKILFGLLVCCFLLSVVVVVLLLLLLFRLLFSLLFRVDGENVSRCVHPWS